MTKTKSTYFLSGAEKSTADFNLRNNTLVLSIRLIFEWGIAIPLPTPVEPNRSLSFNFSIIFELF